MYPRTEVADFLTEHFVPVKVHIKEQPATFDRFNVQWTPVLLVVDGDGVEHHRFEGFLPAPEFRAQLELGLGRLAFGRKRWSEAAQRFRSVVDRFPDTIAAPEAMYWAGVAKYKETADAGALQETAEAFESRYTDTPWATKASVWAQEAG